MHQDGSCNGLQHYAALGRDYDGAVAVNLVDAEKPQDVYSRVLDLVQKRISKDAKRTRKHADNSLAAGSTSPGPSKNTTGGFASPVSEARAVYDMAKRAEERGSTKEASTMRDGVIDDSTELSHIGNAASDQQWQFDRDCARFVQGKVVRKTIKQTVMTSVYGVTFIGAREQIRNRLREMDWSGVGDADKTDRLVTDSSAYLARITLESLGEMFSAADAIKEWLTSTAQSVAALQ